MTTHTQGPLEYFDGGLNGFAIVSPHSPDRLAQVFYKPMQNGKCEGYERAESFARLIAAAPELLTACEMVAKEYTDAADWKDNIAKLQSAARAAIAKATS